MKKCFILVICILIMMFSACGKQIEAPIQPESTKIDEAEQAEADMATEEETTEADTLAVVNEKPYPIIYEESFVPFMPYEALSASVLSDIGADGFSGTPSEIAQQIFDWQISSMQYFGSQREKMDIGYPMRWNAMLPGIFPVSEMVKERVLENGKIYGLCWDYAAIYCAIANAYELETRIVDNGIYMSGRPGGVRGINEKEYAAFYNKAMSKGIELPFDKVYLSMKETWAHYRAEVKLDGVWVPMDASNLAGTSTESLFSESPWYEMYDNILLYSPSLHDVEAIKEMLANAPEAGYEGITDDMGNAHMAEKIEDVFAGKALIPYFEDPEDVILYMHLIEEDAEEVRGEMSDLADEYFNETGKRYNLIADAVIYMYSMDDIGLTPEIFSALYTTLTGEKMSTMEASILMDY